MGLTETRNSLLKIGMAFVMELSKIFVLVKDGRLRIFLNNANISLKDFPIS